MRFGLVWFGLVWFGLVEKRTPWSRRDSGREMPEASFLDTGTFTACSWQKLTVGQSAGSSSQSRSEKLGAHLISLGHTWSPSSQQPPGHLRT